MLLDQFGRSQNGIACASETCKSPSSEVGHGSFSVWDTIPMCINARHGMAQRAEILEVSLRVPQRLLLRFHIDNE